MQPGPWPPAAPSLRQRHTHPRCASGEKLETLSPSSPECGVCEPRLSCCVVVEWAEHRQLEGTARLPPQEHPKPRVLGGAAILCSVPQVVLIVSGNLSFLNWLTIVPSVACFDDASIGFLFPSGPGGLKDQVLKMQKEEAREARPRLTLGRCIPGDVSTGHYSRTQDSWSLEVLVHSYLVITRPSPWGQVS